MTNLTAVMLGLAHLRRRRRSGARLTRAEVERQIELYRSRSTEQRDGTSSACSPSAPTSSSPAPASCRTVMDKLRKDALSVSDRGLRHGLLIDRFGKEELRAS